VANESVLKPVRFTWSRFIRPATVVVSLVAGVFVVQQAVLFSASVSTGRIRETYVAPMYGYMKSPAGLSRQADEKLGADYMCLYFAATNYLATGTMYDSNSDPWHRSAVTFPPHLIFLVAHSIQKASFPTSVLLNTFLQVGFFLVAAFLFVRGGGSVVARLAGLVFAGFLLFCTPAGVTWFERSQTDLYAGIALVFFLKAIRDNRPADFILSGVFGSLKWSSLPFLATTTLVYLWFSKTQASRKVVWAGTTMALALLLPLLMGRSFVDYLRLVVNSEASGQPAGISLAKHLPTFLAKIAVFALPVMMIALHRFWKKTTWNVQSIIEVVFWGANGLIGASFGTVAFEYRLVSLLFLVPFLVRGRSILFPDAPERLSPLSRVCGVVILLLAFRIQTHVAAINSALVYGRTDIPLFGSILLLVAVSLWAARRPRAGGSEVL